MKRVRATMFWSTLILAMMAFPAVATDEFVGKWDASVETRNGTHAVTFDFSSGDNGLEGTFTGPDGVETLHDVAYSDGKLTFTRDTESQGFAATLKYTATVDGNTMNVTVSTPRGERSLTATRDE